MLITWAISCRTVGLGLGKVWYLKEAHLSFFLLINLNLINLHYVLLFSLVKMKEIWFNLNIYYLVSFKSTSDHFFLGMRGSTPLDVAAASCIDNNELALALQEQDLEMVCQPKEQMGKLYDQFLWPLEYSFCLCFFRWWNIWQVVACRAALCSYQKVTQILGGIHAEARSIWISCASLFLLMVCIYDVIMVVTN